MGLPYNAADDNYCVVFSTLTLIRDWQQNNTFLDFVLIEVLPMHPKMPNLIINILVLIVLLVIYDIPVPIYRGKTL